MIIRKILIKGYSHNNLNKQIHSFSVVLNSDSQGTNIESLVKTRCVNHWNYRYKLGKIPSKSSKSS